MHLVQIVKQKSIAHSAMIVLTAVALSTALATDALAAGPGGGIHGGGFGASHIAGRFRGPIMEGVPSPTPEFNPSSPYTVPQSRETPVSAGSPGSIFGND